MNKNDIDQLLDKLNESTTPKPNPEVRKQTISKATEIFRQGLNGSTRHIDEAAQKTAEKPNSIWSKIMNFLSKSNEKYTSYHAFGTVTAVIAVVSVALMSPALFKPRPPFQEVVISDDSVTVDTTTSGVAVTESTNQASIKNEHATLSSSDSQTGSKRQVIAKINVRNSFDQNTIINNKPVKAKQYETLTSESLSQVKPVSSLSEELVASAKSNQPAKTSEWGDDNNAWGFGYSIDYSSAIGKQELDTLSSDSIQMEMPMASLSPEAAVVASSQSLSRFQPSERTQKQSRSARSDIINPIPTQDNREEFADYETSSIKFVADNPISTFSVDVDTASYSLIRNQLNNGLLPSPQAVRIEELINYFDYDYPLPSKKNQPFSSNISVMDSPWNVDKKLVHIGIKGYEVAASEQPDSNIVFLLDVSGSMSQANKLPLVKQSVNLLLDTLKPTDTVSIVVYAGAAGAVLEPTQVKEKTKILNAILNLRASGSTAGGAGIRLAYQLAEQNFSKGAINRIILATDGDFNVGQKSNADLKTLVERKRDSGVFLSVLGFGRGNYQDDMMQTLAQNGNGVAAYIDTLSEAKKVLVDQATSTLFTIAKDVKLQVEFNPTTVSDYRLVGYETRALKKEDFNNDKVDAGDIGAGHTVTAIYEITPRNASTQSIDAPRYTANQNKQTQEGDTSEYGFLKIRYKLPDQSESKLIKAPINISTNSDLTEANFSVAVAGFGQLLANGQHTGKLTYDDVIKAAQNNTGKDIFGYRSEFIQLVRMAKIATP